MKIYINKEFIKNYLQNVTSYNLASTKQYNITGGMIISWRFWNKYGYFIDRDDNSITINGNEFYIETKEEFTIDKYKEIKEFFETESNYNYPEYKNKVTIDINYKEIKKKINDYFKDDETMEVNYFAANEKQYLTFSRELTDEEKSTLKEYLFTFINIT